MIHFMGPWWLRDLRQMWICEGTKTFAGLSPLYYTPGMREMRGTGRVPCAKELPALAKFRLFPPVSAASSTRKSGKSS